MEKVFQNLAKSMKIAQKLNKNFHSIAFLKGFTVEKVELAIPVIGRQHQHLLRILKV